MEQGVSSQFVDWVAGLMSPQAEPSPTRDYYLVLLRRGHGVPEAVRLSIDDLLEEVRAAVAREEIYNPRTHRARLGLPSHVETIAQRLPRPALVRRIAHERIAEPGPQAGRPGRTGGQARERR